MIKVENIKVFNIARAIYSARNAMNSWDKSDSDLENDIVGKADLDLAKRLYQGGPVHAKYLRQIFVTMDVTAPIFFNQELDTYKVGTTRNSCSFQHKGVSKPFSIRDFTVDDERMYEILDPVREKREHALVYQYETKEYKTLEVGDRKYRVYRNGVIVSEPYSVKHSKDNRVRHFQEKELKPNQMNNGYWMLNLGGRRYLRKALVHRIVAEFWLPNNDCRLEVNHIDGNKGNNSVENLEWVTRSENEIHALQNGLKESSYSLAHKYNGYKNARKVGYFDECKIKEKYANGNKMSDIAKEYELSESHIHAICNNRYDDDLHFLFEMCILWEKTINELNRLRDMYLQTDDYMYFRAIRELLPMGYNQRYTLTMNYQVAMNMIDWRENHKMFEWVEFVKILRSLPYVNEIRNDKKEV